MDNIEKKIINNSEELYPYKEQILCLFEECFGSNLDPNLWDWAYKENPNGDAIVSLNFSDGLLVGHYGVIPVEFLIGDEKIKALLSMTTMVHSKFRGKGFFVEQAESVYHNAKELGYAFVYGFPNKNSAPGFVKRLQWTLHEEYYVASLNKDDLLDMGIPISDIIFNVYNKKQFEWRLRKPGTVCNVRTESLVVKNYNNSMDIIHLGNDALPEVSDFKNYNYLISNSNFIAKKQFDYAFGYRFFNEETKKYTFFPELIMSDVF